MMIFNLKMLSSKIKQGLFIFLSLYCFICVKGVYFIQRTILVLTANPNGEFNIILNKLNHQKKFSYYIFNKELTK